MEHTGFEVGRLYLAQVKQKCGIVERKNNNKPKSENAKQPQMYAGEGKGNQRSVGVFSDDLMLSF